LIVNFLWGGEGTSKDEEEWSRKTCADDPCKYQGMNKEI
jgi:hypothetical protein